MDRDGRDLGGPARCRHRADRGHPRQRAHGDGRRPRPARRRRLQPRPSPALGAASARAPTQPVPCRPQRRRPVGAVDRGRGARHRACTTRRPHCCSTTCWAPTPGTCAGSSGSSKSSCGRWSACGLVVSARRRGPARAVASLRVRHASCSSRRSAVRYALVRGRGGADRAVRPSGGDVVRRARLDGRARSAPFESA